MAQESGSPSKYSVRTVTRTASTIWAGLRIQRPMSRAGGGGGHHRALPDNENEDGLPLEDLDHTPPPSGANTPTTKQSFNTSSLHSMMTDNPFENPSHVRNASTTSLNTPDHSTILTESSEPPPILLNSSAVEQKWKGPPPPQPLGLPKPRTPPPRSDQVYIDEPPDRTAAPSTIARGTGQELNESEKDVKWWTEWLCGCSEGTDRGGYNQVRSPLFILPIENLNPRVDAVRTDESQRIKTLRGYRYLGLLPFSRALVMVVELRPPPYSVRR